MAICLRDDAVNPHRICQPCEAGPIDELCTFDTIAIDRSCCFRYLNCLSNRVDLQDISPFFSSRESHLDPLYRYRPAFDRSYRSNNDIGSEPTQRSHPADSYTMVRLTLEGHKNLQTRRLGRTLPPQRLILPLLDLPRSIIRIPRRKRPLRFIHQLRLSLGPPRQPSPHPERPTRCHPNGRPRSGTRTGRMVLLWS